MINRIRAIRKAKGLTLADLAAACQPPTTAQTIGRLETGTRNLSLVWMNRIAAALDVDPQSLVRAEAQEPARIVAELVASGAEAIATPREAVLPHELVTHEDASAPVVIEAEQEKALAVKLLQFVEAINAVSANSTPHLLCTYLYELASLFMTFYEACPMLKDGVKEETKQSRLALSLLVANTLKQGLELLGIETMEKM